VQLAAIQPLGSLSSKARISRSSRRTSSKAVCKACLEGAGGLGAATADSSRNNVGGRSTAGSSRRSRSRNSF